MNKFNKIIKEEISKVFNEAKPPKRTSKLPEWFDAERYYEQLSEENAFAQNTLTKIRSIIENIDKTQADPYGSLNEIYNLIYDWTLNG